MTKSSVPGALLGVLVAIGLAVPTVAHAFAAPLVRTPFVGRAWQTGVGIWVGTSATFGDSSTETLTLRIREFSACETCWLTSVQMTSTGTGAGFRSWLGEVGGLQPGTRYAYGIFASGYTGERGGLNFRTEPAGPSRFKVAVASCMNGANAPSQPSWNIVEEQLNTGEPNFMVLLGDNMYTTLNPPTKDHYWFKYFEQRNVPEFANAFRAFPTMAIWDDHDYGPNNEDGTFGQKDIARSAYLALYPHHPLAATEGIYHNFAWGGDSTGAGGGVEFFMMDDRWGRVCPQDPSQMYGATQFNWLKSALLASKATFKVIANGSTLNSDCWGTQDESLFNFITANKIGGVLFITGDIHRSGVTTRTPAGGYPLYELISSGIGSPSGTATNPPEWSFGIMEFDTTLADPTVTIKVINNPEKRSSITGAGVTVSTRTLRRSQLQN